MNTPIASPLRVDPLAAALLPVLMHRLNNATQILHGWNALVTVGAFDSERGAADLAFASQVVDETGWALAVLASASGADLLLARRERRGIAPLLDAVQAALRRSDRDLASPEETPPSLAPSAADGWQVPWAIAAWLHASALALPAASTLEWCWKRARDADEIVCRTADHGRRDELELRIGAHLRNARFRRTDSEHALVLPSGSLEWEAQP
jgi:hypothetical protein